MSEVRLVGCVLPNPEDVVQAFLVHRRDHAEWQLPGGEVGEDMTPEEAVIRHVEGKVGVRIDPVNLRYLGSVASSGGDMHYAARIYAATKWEGHLTLAEWAQYSDAGFYNLLGYKLARIGLSPVVAKFRQDLMNEKILPWWENPVQ